MEEYIFADTHFGDEKVRKLSRKRFKTIQEHDETIIKNLERINFKKDDKLYILGDFGRLKGQLKERFKALPVEKTLLRGNHDNEEEEFYKEQGINKVIDKPFYKEGQVIFSHEPQPMNSKYIINVHGDLHGEVIDDPNYINVSVDVNFYRAQNLKTLLKRKDSLKRIRTRHYEKRWHKGKTRKIHC